MGNPYVLATISAPENLAKLDRLAEINRRLLDEVRTRFPGDRGRHLIEPEFQGVKDLGLVAIDGRGPGAPVRLSVRNTIRKV